MSTRQKIYKMVNIVTVIFTFAFIFNSTVCAVEVDIYQHIGNGTPSITVTSEGLSQTSIGGINGLPLPDWDLVITNPENQYSGLWISSDHVKPIPGFVTVDGKNYSGMGGNTLSIYHKYMTNRIDIKFGDERQWAHTPYHDKMTVACFFNPGTWFPSSNMFLDMIILSGTVSYDGAEPQYNYAVLSLQNGNSDTTVNVSVHTEKGSGPRITLNSGHTYWVNLQYNGPEGKGKLVVFDPDDNWNQVGQTSELEFQASSNPMDTKVKSKVKIGRCDTHANYTSDSNPQTYFSHIMVDYTHAKFPLLPDVTGSVPDTPTNLKLLKIE